MLKIVRKRIEGQYQKSVIYTFDGNFKVRKNGKYMLVIERGTPNEEIIKVSKVKGK